MQRTVYDKRSFRRLERKQCAVSLLLGEAAGDCRGSIHRHHTDPEDESSRTVEVCATRTISIFTTFCEPSMKRASLTGRSVRILPARTVIPERGKRVSDGST